MNEPDPLASDERPLLGPVFISYATADRKQALSACKALERRGTGCWISCRDVQPGENYQEAIVRAIRVAPAMVLLFSGAANNSDEIKKELSLGSRFRIPVMALRIEDVEPTDAFAYELSTRQWIDAFEGWDESFDVLAERIRQLSPNPTAAPQVLPAPNRPTGPAWRRNAVLVTLLAALLLAGAAWWFLRPAPAVAHTMTIRLTAFERLSPDLPATLPDAIRDEVIAAFNDDGVIGVSTATVPPPGTAPAYALGGTVRRDGDKIRVIARLTNERSGTTLWSSTFSYDGAEVARVPRHIAVDAGNQVRCGLFGASTYSRPLPDAVMSDYLQACFNINTAHAPTKSLNFARKVVAAEPKFSWGWSAVEVSALISTIGNESSPDADALRKEGLTAAAMAVRLDPTNSEALAFESHLIDPADLTAREALLKRALNARALPCGCEHHFYGEFLTEVGRTGAAIGEFHRSIDILALDPDSQIALGNALLAGGKPDDAKPHLDAAIDLVSDSSFAQQVTIESAPMTNGYAAGLRALADPNLPYSSLLKDKVAAGFRAMLSNDPAAKSKAAAGLASLAPETNGRLVVSLLGALGANREALRHIEAAAAARKFLVREWLFLPSLAGARADPAFPGVAQRLGLMSYWRASKTRPDFCSPGNAPPVCRMI